GFPLCDGFVESALAPCHYFLVELEGEIALPGDAGANHVLDVSEAWVGVQAGLDQPPAGRLVLGRSLAPRGTPRPGQRPQGAMRQSGWNLPVISELPPVGRERMADRVKRRTSSFHPWNIAAEPPWPRRRNAVNQHGRCGGVTGRSPPPS